MDIELLPNEEFKMFAKGYFISNYGRVYSTKTNKFLETNKNNSGYLRTEIYLNGKRKHVFIHIKVVEMFGDCNGKKIPKGSKTLHEADLEIDHLNRNKNNCSVFNLELVPIKTNRQRWRDVPILENDELGW